ncbi:FAD-dependent oxidoreductase [Spelaeicoccus albus]|uniref:2-polyprenyl-6-methoxyphenol hydroxylase-like FAD-dependent oxidoreductase n=1 Tax=Spelaeicoccus albus TaxID=1280376 RepID=A0A7Z0AA71_9MICO|nr:FAD-dependent oxidoreductase [Spelaeicoccus albus]NYI67142.1 2-polyprenyl-6-methoxyphenol hydroxylase-like FAD-dependent oxidoreductase [Spelaeicoccus albus]
MTNDGSNPIDVAVVGAGPVGLLLAGELAARGVDVVVLERADSPSSTPKANGIVGHSAVELASRGVFNGTEFAVMSPPVFQFGPLALDLGSGNDNPLHILPVPQRRLEDLLETRAVRHGARIHRGHEVAGFTQDGAGVGIDACAGDGTTEIRVRFLVGCDGARSFVRKHADIGFPGFTGDEISRIARVRISADRMVRTDGGFEIAGVGEVAAMRMNRLAGGGLTIAPMDVLDRSAPDDLYLISTREPRGDAEPGDALSADELRASLRRVTGAEIPFTDATAIRSTVGNSRLADAYRRDRVFLAGDAAHVFNAGGSALNVGLEDAFDLAPRLAAAVRDVSLVGELDGYESVRRLAGERTLQHTRAQAALARDDEESRAVCEVVGGLTSEREVSRSLARLLESA